MRVELLDESRVAATAALKPLVGGWGETSPSKEETQHVSFIKMIAESRMVDGRPM